MKLKLFSAVLIFSVMTMTSCQKEKGIVLKMDYSAKEQWVYTLDYKSQGIFTQNDSTVKKNTDINCSLSGDKNKESNKLTLKVDNIQISSDMFDDEVKQQLTDQLSKAEYSLLLQDGYPIIDTAVKLPAGSFHEWDLLKQFAKLLPSLPPKPIHPGFTWERTVSLPIKTDIGSVPCEIYRYYTLDSLSTDNNIAFISWQFRYSADQEFQDSVDIIKQIPVAGNGNGSAQLDLKNNCILQAEMDFKSPVATIGQVKVDWREQAVLKLVSSK